MVKKNAASQMTSACENESLIDDCSPQTLKAGFVNSKVPVTVVKKSYTYTKVKTLGYFI